MEYHYQSDHRRSHRHRRGLRPASLPIVLASLPHPFPLPKEDNLPKRGHPLPRRTVFLKGPASPQRAGNGSPSGLSGREKMITKMPIRLLSLSMLDLRNRERFWDIGFCTGSVSIEAKLLFPHLHITSFEIREEGRKLMTENCRRFGTPGIEAIICLLYTSDAADE